MAKPAYRLGISSGLVSIAQGIDDKEQYLNVLKKVWWAAQRGVDFAQMDLDSIAEFIEPGLKEHIKKIRELGLGFGIHGETVATGSRYSMVLESALDADYGRSHERFMHHVEGAAKVGADYILLHVSEYHPFILLSRELQPTQLVDPFGNPLDKFLEDHPDILQWAAERNFIFENVMRFGITPEDDRYEHLKASRSSIKVIVPQKEGGGVITDQAREITPEEDADLKKQAKKMMLNEIKSRVLEGIRNPGAMTYGTERFAYYVIAKWMEKTGDPLWKDIVGNGELDKLIDPKGNPIENYKKWVPAVAAKYIWGHFNPKNKKKYKDPKPILAKHKVKWVFEPEMAAKGYELHMRIVKLKDIYYLVKNIGSPWVRMAIDGEHLLSAGLDPIKEVDELPQEAGRKMYVAHLGWPVPHAPAHIPVPLGSDAQLYLYEMLYRLRKKGMKEGIFIFERGGGEDPVKQSILAMRKIAKYLEMGIPPKQLPEDFYGLGKDGPEFIRQEVIIRKNALNPLKGLLSVPEEDFGFLGKTAVEEKRRGEEWKRREFR